MKILRVAASMDPVKGGPPQGIRNSIPALSSFGIETEVVCCDRPNPDWAGRDGFPIHTVGPGRFGYAYAAGLECWLEANLDRFDGVISHGLWLWPGLAAFRAWKKRKKPGRGFFVMPHGMLDPWFQRDRSRRVKAVRNFFYWWLAERRVVNRADALLFTCEEELRLARQTFGGYRPRREIDTGYGIPDPPDFTPKMTEAFLKWVPELEDRPYLLFLARIHPKKGVDLLVRAYREILKMEKPNSEFPRLVIAGPGWESEFGRAVRSAIAGEPRIHPVGMLEGDEKWGALHGCTAFILPSHQENFGIAVVEALACNKPVHISNKVNIWREIQLDRAGTIAADDFEGTLYLLRSALRDGGSGGPQRFRDCFGKRFAIESAARKLASVLEDSKSWR
jgi:glycosyltransferase involved in cell wall biosynthesis